MLSARQTELLGVFRIRFGGTVEVVPHLHSPTCMIRLTRGTSNATFMLNLVEMSRMRATEGLQYLASRLKDAEAEIELLERGARRTIDLALPKVALPVENARVVADMLDGTEIPEWAEVAAFLRDQIRVHELRQGGPSFSGESYVE